MNALNSWIVAQGGLVGLGVELARFSLILFSIVALAVTVERALVLRRVRAHEAALYPRLLEQLPRIDQESSAPCAAIARAGARHLDGDSARIREATESATIGQIAALQFNLPILASAASTAPYIGLFGTVLGILGAFGEIARSGQTGASVVAGGITEALTATALGLGVAIPAVLAYNYFSGRINALALEIEMHALEIAARLEELARTKPAAQTAQTQTAQAQTAQAQTVEIAAAQTQTAQAAAARNTGVENAVEAN